MGSDSVWCGEAPADRIIEKLSYNNDDEAALLHHIIEQLSNMETHVISTSQAMAREKQSDKKKEFSVSGKDSQIQRENTSPGAKLRVLHVDK